VKVNDFATDTLVTIAENLRRKYPQIPCLLAITCLHELYPPEIEDHPPYPPDFESLQRAITGLKGDFQKLCDRTVMIDFTWKKMVIIQFSTVWKP
jgi:hypothetical protein